MVCPIAIRPSVLVKVRIAATLPVAKKFRPSVAVRMVPTTIAKTRTP